MQISKDVIVFLYYSLKANVEKKRLLNQYQMNTSYKPIYINAYRFKLFFQKSFHLQLENFKYMKTLNTLMH